MALAGVAHETARYVRQANGWRGQSKSRLTGHGPEPCGYAGDDYSTRNDAMNPHRPWDLFLFIAVVLLARPSLAQLPVQDHARILQTAEAFAREQAEHAGVRLEVKAGGLDPRLRLSACEIPLQAALAPGARAEGSTAVKVSCEGVRPWRLYVRVQIRLFAPVVVTNHPLSRGAAISPGDIRLEERELSALPRGYLMALSQAEGLTVKRALTRGEPLRAALLERPRVIKRGQSVTLVAGTGGLQVKTTGTALKDGAVGDRISARSASRRIIEGVVTEDGQIRVDK